MTAGEKRRTWTYRIDETVPTANVFMRMPRLRRGRHRKRDVTYQQDLILRWYWMLYEAGIMEIHKAKVKRGVVMKRFSPGVPDPPNLYLTGDKLILDNLVKMGLLVDDSGEWCQFTCLPEVSKEKYTIIEIREPA